jgi:hypothetical protein
MAVPLPRLAAHRWQRCVCARLALQRGLCYSSSGGGEGGGGEWLRLFQCAHCGRTDGGARAGEGRATAFQRCPGDSGRRIVT